MGLPTARSVRLGRELRGLREQRALSQNEVARLVGATDSKLSRIESGERTITSTDLEALLELYGLTSDGTRWGRLKALAAEVAVKDWWDEHSDAVEPAYMEWLGLEDVATRMSIFQAALIPILLQTPDYARAVEQARRPYRSRREIDTAVGINRQRQDVLTRAEHPAELEAILDESALRREVGGRHVTADQLSQLLTLGQAPNVVLRVLPFSAGAWRCPASTFVQFTLTDTADAPTDVVAVEHAAGCLYVDDPDDVRRFGEAYEDARDKALDPDKSAELIDQIAKAF
jgi:transcriptional regulator with XRE-family HTH domain